MKLFNFRFHLKSALHPGRDYRSPGIHFVTICTHDRRPYFGSVVNHQMILSTVGKIALLELLKTPEIRNNVEIVEWVMMPNQVHVIFRILPASLPNVASQKNRVGPQSDNLPAIVLGYKSAVKRWTNIHNLDFRWEARYSDRVIWNEAELRRIRWYILQNATMWIQDC